MITKAAHEYCLTCNAESIEKVVMKDGTKEYRCKTCGTLAPQRLYIDPHLIAWKDPQTGEYWHESAGAFIAKENGEMLFLDRVNYPFGLTIPAGHVEKEEGIWQALAREIKEETGIDANEKNTIKISDEDIEGDACSRGANHHKWHLYKITVPNDIKITSNNEAKSYLWLNKEAIKSANLVPAIKYLFERYIK